MTKSRFITDSASGTLAYTGDSELTVDADELDISEAETVTIDSPWNDFFGTDTYVTFDATVAQPVSLPYFYEGRLRTFKKDEDELRRAQAQIDNLPWTTGHPEKKRITTAQEIRGFWKDPRYNDGQKATLYVPDNDPDAIRFAVENDGVSPGFSGDIRWTDDAPHDGVQVNMAYDHIASVDRGRCTPEKGCELPTNDSAPEDHGHVFATDEVGTRTTQVDQEWSTYGGIKWRGTRDGDLDESEIPNDDFESHYVFDADTKSESSFPLVDADGYLRRENVIAAASYSSDAPDESKLMDVLEHVNGKFDDPPLNEDTFADCACTDCDCPSASLDKHAVLADSELETDDPTNMTDIQTFIDENDLSVEDVVEALDVSKATFTDEAVNDIIDSLDIDVPDEPTAFYDGQPDIDTLKEDFDAVTVFADEKEKLEERVEDLNDELAEYRKQDFEQKAERLTEITDSFGTKDELIEEFEDDEMTVDELDEKIQIAEDIIESETTTVNDGGSGGGNDDVPEHDSMTEDGRFDLRQRTKF